MDQQLVFLIRDVRVFDGRSIVPFSSVMIRDGKISAIDLGATPPAGAEVVDGRGKTLIP